MAGPPCRPDAFRLLRVPPEVVASLARIVAGSALRKNYLAALPTPLPSNLRILECSVNMLYRLPDLPSTLEVLLCQDQRRGMKELPALNRTALRILLCVGNGLRALPDLPESLA